MGSTKKRGLFYQVARKFFGEGMVWFTVPFLVFVFVGAILILALKKGDIVIAINSVSNAALDKVFLVVTTAGLGSVMALAGIILAFYKFRWSLLVFIDLGLTAIFTNIFKRLFFVHLPRPMNYFLYDDFPRFIYDVPLSFFNTFPSGHTLTIYAICSLMAFLANRKPLGVLFFAVALSVEVSRMYLLQHFFIDTYFGAIFGVMSTFITLWFDEKFKLAQKKVLNENVFNLTVKKVSA